MKFSKVMEDVIGDMAGGDVMPVVRNLRKNMVSEIELAKETNSELNILRSQLYKLHKHNIVNCKRKRTDKGMYEYYWAFNLTRLKNLVRNANENRLEELKEKLAKEENSQYYMCSNRCVRFDFDQAANFEFKCPECGMLVEQEDNSEKIKLLKKEIKKLI